MYNKYLILKNRSDYMKCNYCGKELPQDADFCPECGMIISLDGTEEPQTEENEVEIPESEPNVFKAMDFEEEEARPAMELEADEKEESAVVVEVIPEYVPEAEEAEEKAEEVKEAEPVFAPDEYKPQEIIVSAEANEEAPAEDGFAPEEPEEPVKEQEEATEEVVEDGFAPETDGFAPPEYTSDLSYLDEKKDAEEKALTQAEALFGEVADVAEEPSGDTIVMNLETIKQAQIEREDEVEVRKPAEEDNSLIEALFDSKAYPANNKKDDIEDITQAHNDAIKKQKEKNAKNDKKKSSNKGYAMVFALVFVLVGIIFASGYVVDNVLPKIKEPTTNASASTSTPSSTLPTTTKGDVTTKEPATTTKPGDTTTKPGDTTTKPGDTTSTTNPGATSTTVPTTTAPTTTSPTTTAPTTTSPTTTAPTTTTKASVTVKQPSSWNMSTKIFFPSSGSITVRYSPSSSGEVMGTHAYGYPLWAFASENGYYYVQSPYLGVYGWVSTSGLSEYVTTTAATTTTRPTTTQPTTRPSTTRPTTTRPTTTQPTTAYDDGYVEYATPYTAEIYPPQNDDLNFRSGPGTQYTVKGKVGYGFTVIVHGYSSTSDGWVYAEVSDSRYGGSMEGWVYADYLK